MSKEERMNHCARKSSTTVVTAISKAIERLIETMIDQLTNLSCNRADQKTIKEEEQEHPERGKVSVMKMQDQEK